MKQKTLLFLSFFLTIAFYYTWWNTTLLSIIDYKIYDYLSVSSDKPPESFASVVVEIDDKSLNVLGQWPWPRILTAKLLEKVSSAQPAASSFDIIFPEEDRTSPVVIDSFYNDFLNLKTSTFGLPDELMDNDQIFANIIKNKNVILPIYFDIRASSQDECVIHSSSVIQQKPMLIGLYNSPYILCNLPKLQSMSKAVGHIQAAPDRDGIFRRIPLLIQFNDVLIPNLAVAAIKSVDPEIIVEESASLMHDIFVQITGQKFETDKQTNVLLQFYPSRSYPTISALDVLNGNYDPSLFRGKFVYIGLTAIGLHDSYTLNDGKITAGVFAHATLTENIFNKTLTVQPSIYKDLNILISLLVSFAMAFLMIRQKYLTTLSLFFTTYFMSIIISYIMIYNNVYISLAYFIIPLIGYLFFLSIILFFINSYDRKAFYVEMSQANTAMLESMALVAETRDTDTGAHIIRTKDYINILAKYLSSKNIYKSILTPKYILNLYHAAPLHDIGKVGIPDNILKKNGKLTVEEIEVMKTHPVLGKEIIENAMRTYKYTPMLSIAADIAFCHHEKWDGTGYPSRLKGEDIPLAARLMAIADVFDALISERCYKPAYTFEKAEEIIIQGRGRNFDPILVDSFLVLKEEFRTIANRH